MRQDPEEEAKERESVSSEGSAAPAGDEPATWHGSSVEVDDLWPGTAAPAQEVSPRYRSVCNFLTHWYF